ncbi:hypothetical protein U9M48_019825 [Paspalum notatum var. saurae]|uniref:Bacterial surface antigen (D15) domain-containing protein n=1 Tax=Paspalum notatum var. saurae TaxID=547442 RepID=A0AAQ3WRY6_PASNO
MAQISSLSGDLLKSSLKEHLVGVSVALLSTMNHNLAYNLAWQTLTDPARMSSNSVQEQLGHRLLSSIRYTYKVDQRDSSIRPTRGYAFLSSSQLGGLAPGSKNTHGILEGFYLGVNRSLVCCLGGLSTLSGFKGKDLEQRDFRTCAPNISDNDGASTSPELDGGDIAVTAFADLSFDLPLKPLRELGIHGHAAHALC